MMINWEDVLKKEMAKGEKPVEVLPEKEVKRDTIKKDLEFIKEERNKAVSIMKNTADNSVKNPNYIMMMRALAVMDNVEGYLLQVQ